MPPAPESTPTHPLQSTPWDRIAASREFQDLVAVKKLFIVPAFVFFFTYYLALPVLVGFAPRVMGIRILGGMTIAYVFALSQFLVGWLIAWLYLRAASRFDALSRDILDSAQVRRGEE